MNIFDLLKNDNYYASLGRAFHKSIHDMENDVKLVKRLKETGRKMRIEELKAIWPEEHEPSTQYISQHLGRLVYAGLVSRCKEETGRTLVVQYYGYGGVRKTKEIPEVITYFIYAGN